MFRLIRPIVIPNSPAGWISVIFGGLSILGLARYGLEQGFGPTFIALLDYYERLIETLLGWATPHLRSWILTILSHWDLDLALGEHWKHFFVLLGIYFFRNAGVSFATGAPVTALFRILWGGAVALSASVAAGLIPVGATAWSAKAALGVSPVVAVLVYRIGYHVWAASVLRTRWPETFRVDTSSWLGFVRGGLIGDVARTAPPVIIAVGVLSTPALDWAASPGIVFAAGYIAALGLYFLFDGYATAARLAGPGEDWKDVYWRTGPAKLGSAIIGTFVWGALYIAGNAGLALFDL